ncbi:MAG: helix-turn-helix transcriptional regulator [Synergistaceae bacterium]|nr:helix-turn-helix transcriptional regulator [Synergistaceae bacterium]
MTLREQLCTAMRTLIAESGITMAELARKTGITRGNIHRVMKSDNVSLCTLERILAVFDADIGILVDGEKVKPLPPDYAAIMARRRGRPPKQEQAKRGKPAKKLWSWKLPEQERKPEPEPKQTYTVGNTAFEVGKTYVIGGLTQKRRQKVSRSEEDKGFSMAIRYDFEGKAMKFVGKYGVNYVFESDRGFKTSFTEFDLRQRGMCG